MTITTRLTEVLDQGSLVTDEMKALADKVEWLLERDFKESGLPQKVRVYHETRALYEKMDTLRKDVYHMLNHVEKVLLPEAMDSEGVDSIKMPELGRTYYVQTRFSATVKDKQRLFEWLRDTGNEDYIEETVNSSKLTALCKEMELSQGISPPEDAVNFRSFYTIGHTRAGN